VWLPACWAFLSTPADVLVLDPIAHPARMGTRITSICPFVRWSFRMWDLPMCGWYACIVNHWRSMTSVWNIGTLCIPPAHSVSLSLSPYRVVVSPLCISMHSTCVSACLCAVHLLVPSHDMHQAMSVWESVCPALLQSIPTDLCLWFSCLAVRTQCSSRFSTIFYDIFYNNWPSCELKKFYKVPFAKSLKIQLEMNVTWNRNLI